MTGTENCPLEMVIVVTLFRISYAVPENVPEIIVPENDVTFSVPDDIMKPVRLVSFKLAFIL